MGLLIGVVGRPEMLESGNEIYYINREINEAIIKNGGTVITLVPNMIETFTNKNINNTKKMSENEFKKLKSIIDICDGIICQGGEDYYDYDLKIIEYCYQIDKPLMGICLGMQTMACLFGGKMKLLNNFSHKSRKKYVHNIKINKDSKLYEILQVENLMVNSRHKSVVIATDLNCVAFSCDGIIEGVEDKNKRFFIGVEWHPESMIEYDIVENKLFSYFIDCCRGKV